MKKYLALFVCLFSAVVLADDPSGSFDVTNLFNDVSALIVSFVGALGFLLSCAGVAYLIFLGWRKYQEACCHIEDDNDSLPPMEDYLDWLEHKDDERDVYLEHYDSDGCSVERLGDVIVGGGDDYDLPCDSGLGCCCSAECPYWHDAGYCTIGRE